MVAAEMVVTMPRVTASQASSGQVHLASGTSVSAGSWQASALTSACCTGLNRAGRPDRGRSTSPAMPQAANRPRHLGLAQE
jgi:hypothetical protein